MMMGVWFLSISIGSVLAGKVASYFDDRSVTSLVKLFGFLALAPIGAAILLMVLTPRINRLLRRRDGTHADGNLVFDEVVEGVSG